ncbi:bifunctional diguanylate cyclase/phosphodiesterase [[Leptolyngbya] sp. PCC 7376]|uniref:bifunctional diguanylate cyclase/phosphodiesterase n=1 Tax=[Leptolyngbya] sp. PCC 7376 TaxID=111781 RepID=UPI001C1E6E0B|nr:EAL domain-containing protein [[Leptolyngbya] sp. PCC 7376]
MSHSLLFMTYVAVIFLFVYSWLRGNAQGELSTLYWLSLGIIVSSVAVHVGGHFFHFMPASDGYIVLAIAVHSLLIAAMLLLMYRLLPIISFILDLRRWQTVEQVKAKLRRKEKEQEETQFALRNSEDRFRSIFDQAAMGIAIVNVDGLILDANQAYYDSFVDSVSGLPQRYFFDGVDLEGSAKDKVILSELFRHKNSPYGYTKRYLRKNQSALWFNVQLSLVEPKASDQTPYAIAMLENITQQKQTEQVLIKTQERLQHLLQVRADQISQMNEELSWQSSHDHLTGLLNRVAFERHLTSTLKSLEHNPQITKHTLCYLNLDRFKAINELGGTLAGDEVLRQVSKLIESRCRQTDQLARLGSDEFALLLHQCPIEQAQKVAESIVELIQDASFHWEGHEYTLSVSLGLVPINNGFGGDATEMIMVADAACTVAKKRGRSRIHVYESNDQEFAKYRSEAQWIQKIKTALERDGFSLYVQSILPLCEEASGYRRCEILIRMLGDDGEVISPGLFLPAAERYHLMTQIDYWVIENTLKYLAEHESPEMKKGDCYSINLSGMSINDDSLVDFLQTQFERYPVPTEHICFEVTETVAISNLSRANEVIQSIRAMGCQIALDDFGAGMSSFNYLKYLPVDYLKIDGSFIKDIVDDPIDHAMVETINRIGHVMGIKTVAEYVSNEAILQKIKHIGIDYAQGYCISRPIPLSREQAQLT